jgi:hypothetical protein
VISLTVEQISDPEFDLEQFVIDEAVRRIEHQHLTEFLEAVESLLMKTKHPTSEDTQ